MTHLAHVFGSCLRSRCCLAVWLLATGAAQADNISWRNPDGGTFSNTGNWFGGSVPDGDDYAFFGLSSGPFGLPNYTVNFNASATNFGLVIQDDQVTFDLNSNLYETTQFDAVTIGTTRSAGLTVMDGIFVVPFQSEFAVGAVANRTGSLTVSTGGLIIGDPSLEIGVVGTGILTIHNGGDILSDRTHIGFLENTTGTATVTGAGSRLVAVEVFVGNAGNGTLNVTNDGGVEVNGDAWIGNLAGSVGTANVGGAGAELDSSGSLTVGHEGTGELNITAGGRVENTNAVIGRFAGANDSAVTVSVR